MLWCKNFLNKKAKRNFSPDFLFFLYDTISESKSGKDKSQYIAYVEKDEISSIAFIQLPEDSQNYDDMIIGYIYATNKCKT